MTLPTLSDQQTSELRRRHPYAQAADAKEMFERAPAQGWKTASDRYLQDERTRATAAMQSLMKELDIDRPSSVAEAVELLGVACGVFASDGTFAASADSSAENVLRVALVDCPVYAAFKDLKPAHPIPQLEQQLESAPSCFSWYLLRGWLDALGVDATDTILQERKWNDDTCVVVVRVEAA